MTTSKLRRRLHCAHQDLNVVLEVLPAFAELSQLLRMFDCAAGSLGMRPDHFVADDLNSDHFDHFDESERKSIADIMDTHHEYARGRALTIQVP